MLQTVPSAGLRGLEVFRVRVEVSITRGTPMIQVVGLAASAVREGRERIRAATRQLDLHVPGLRITVNLAPADVPKGGSLLDLPITAGILAAAGKLPRGRTGRYGMVGELGLDGALRPLRGALPVALHFQEAGDVDGVILPRPNLSEARPAAGLPVLGAGGLEEVVAFLRGEQELPQPGDVPAVEGPSEDEAPDLADVCGQEQAKRALVVAAAGGHNLLLRGEPGAGKTMLARRLPGLLPPLTRAEAVEATAVHSVAGRLPPGSGLLTRPPYRAPHHTVTAAGLAGGGSVPRPGEISLAHRGVLFLDELPEYRRQVLEVLRQPLEEGRVTLVRARTTATFPARFLLVAAMNPCPCGFLASGEERCTCGPAAVRAYARKVSGPLLDRIDLQVEVPAVSWRELRSGPGGEDTAAARARVVEARRRAGRRLGPRREAGLAPGASVPEGVSRREGTGGGERGGSSGCGRRGAGRNGGPGRPAAPLRANAEMTEEEVREHCVLDPEGEALLRRAVEAYGLTARAYHRVLKVARTAADLAGSDRVRREEVAEALRHRVAADRATPP